MSLPQPPDLQFALRAYDQLIRFDRFNVVAICDVGHALQRLNRATESRKCYKTAVETQRAAVEDDRAPALSVHVARPGRSSPCRRAASRASG